VVFRVCDLSFKHRSRARFEAQERLSVVGDSRWGDRCHAGRHGKADHGNGEADIVALLRGNTATSRERR
jgi:hypothetical protein